jgi:hypothetical protein
MEDLVRPSFKEDTNAIALLDGLEETVKPTSTIVPKDLVFLALIAQISFMILRVIVLQDSQEKDANRKLIFVNLILASREFALMAFSLVIVFVKQVGQDLNVT